MAKREITFFDVEPPKPKKKTASSKKGAASAVKKASASPKKTTSAAKKTAASPKKTTSPAKKTSPSGTKKNASTSKKGMNTKVKKKVEIQENPLARSRSSVARVANARKPAAKQPPRRMPPPPKRRKKRAADGLSALLMVCIAAMVALGLWRFSEYQNFRVMKQAVSAQTFYSGTTVDGVDVSGMTLPQAIAHWDGSIEPRYRDTAVLLDDGTRITAQQLGYSSDYADVLSNAWNSGRSGSLEERYAHLTNRMDAGISYSVTRSMYQDDIVARCAAALAQKVDAQPTAASIQSFDLSSYTFRFSDGKNGRKLDQQRFIADAKAVLNNGGGTIDLSVAAIPPSTTRADIENQYGLICYAVTNASSSNSNRLNNIKRSLELINGTCLEPGQTFSFNQVVGQRTEARGFKVATAYSSGEVTEQVGGGICQVSTTLWNAAVKADLKINERHPHSLTVNYVDLGKDAAVDWGNKDLRFTNNTNDKIYICCYLTGDKRVRFGIFGKKLPNGESITVEGMQTGTVDYPTERQVSFVLGSGESRVIQKGKNGYTATTYKIRWDANGNQIGREELCKSRYSPTTEIIEYGP